MFRNIFDPNKTIRHMSYRDMRLQNDRNIRVTNRLYAIIIAVSIIAMAIVVIVQLLAT